MYKVRTIGIINNILPNKVSIVKVDTLVEAYKTATNVSFDMSKDQQIKIIFSDIIDLSTNEVVDIV